MPGHSQPTWTAEHQQANRHNHKRESSSSLRQNERADSFEAGVRSQTSSEGGPTQRRGNPPENGGSTDVYVPTQRMAGGIRGGFKDGACLSHDSGIQFDAVA